MLFQIADNRKGRARILRRGNDKRRQPRNLRYHVHVPQPRAENIADARELFRIRQKQIVRTCLRIRIRRKEIKKRFRFRQNRFGVTRLKRCHTIRCLIFSAFCFCRLSPDIPVIFRGAVISPRRITLRLTPYSDMHPKS